MELWSPGLFANLAIEDKAHFVALGERALEGLYRTNAGVPL